jgi:hypothetical protein
MTAVANGFVNEYSLSSVGRNACVASPTARNPGPPTPPGCWKQPDSAIHTALQYLLHLYWIKLFLLLFQPTSYLS